MRAKRNYDHGLFSPSSSFFVLVAAFHSAGSGFRCGNASPGPAALRRIFLDSPEKQAQNLPETDTAPARWLARDRA
jgi:hypothetical protein